MIETLSQSWPWYISGPLIAMIMFLLLWAGGNFGVSSNLRTICAIGGAGKQVAFFNYKWKDQTWNLLFIVGAIIGGVIAHTYLSSKVGLNLSEATITDLAALGIPFSGAMAPEELFNWHSLTTVRGILVLVVGGFMVGFGARWAGGCTSGHAISGLSNLQQPSLIAVIGFFIGGLIMTFLLFPLIFSA